MAKSHGKSAGDAKRKSVRWILCVFFSTIVISAVISLASEEVMDNSSVWAAFLILFIIVFIGILFDIVGVAVTSATDTPFHSMAARKVPGAQESIRLLKNAERVSSICNDVIGDICGVVSGSAAAAIAMRVTANVPRTAENLVTLALSALVAGLTVGGKAIGKTIAIGSCTKIVYTVGVILYHCRRPFRPRQKKNHK
ncbi:MAG: hypothetical protein PUF71_04155 [Firmicutes bacterium]|nr:hypothetical protein [Bacillota bacterium]